jgi:hypothetical protein
MNDLRGSTGAIQHNVATLPQARRTRYGSKTTTLFVRKARKASGLCWSSQPSTESPQTSPFQALEKPYRGQQRNIVDGRLTFASTVIAPQRSVR